MNWKPAPAFFIPAVSDQHVEHVVISRVVCPRSSEHAGSFRAISHCTGTVAGYLQLSIQCTARGHLL
jgi:hypothetical protein